MLKYKIPQIVTLTQNKAVFKLSRNIIKTKRYIIADISLFLSLLSDSNQRPRDYKSRALAN